jgi:hypothetical protein
VPRRDVVQFRYCHEAVPLVDLRSRLHLLPGCFGIGAGLELDRVTLAVLLEADEQLPVAKAELAGPIEARRPFQSASIYELVTARTGIEAVAGEELASGTGDAELADLVVDNGPWRRRSRRSVRLPRPR